MDYKYLVLFPIPEPFDGELRTLMDTVKRYTQLPQPYLKLRPHVTFHKPIAGIEECRMRNMVSSMVLASRQSRVVVGQLYNFGEEYIVRTIISTRQVSALWSGINDLLAKLPEYEHGPYDDDNTLHITIAEKTTSVFPIAWPLIKAMRVEPMEIPLKRIDLYRKPVKGGHWERVERFYLPV